MSKFKYIDEGLSRTKREIRSELRDLEESLSANRETMRYHNQRYRSAKDYQKRLNNKKQRLLRQIAKVDDIQASLNPAPIVIKKEVTNG